MTEEVTMKDMADAMRGRMATYQMLARIFRVEVDQEFLDQLVAMRFPVNTGNAKVDAGMKAIWSYLTHASETVLIDLAIDYVRTFIGGGNDAYSAAYPYESVYTSPKRLMMQAARDEVLAIYRAAGLGKEATWKEAEDHLALELEYEQILAERSAAALEAGDEQAAVRAVKASRNFLEDHLCAWYPMMAQDIQKFARTSFYQGAGQLTEGFLAYDLDFLSELLGETARDAEGELEKAC